MENPDLIATLIPVDKEKRAENAFCLDKNKDLYLPPTRGISGGPTISSREATPAGDRPDNDHCQYDSTHRLQLTFDQVPKDPSKGYSFGTDAQRCDVVLRNRGTYGISGLQFCITFDDTIDHKTHLVLKDSSTNGTAVGYSDQAKYEVRRHFTWILDLSKEGGEWEFVVHARGLSFKVELASHQTCKAEYEEKLTSFLKRSSTALPPVDRLGIDSYTTTAQPSQASTPKQLPVYISERELGRGSFGRVDKVIDVSTGARYARKEFFEPRWVKNEQRRRERKEQWLDQVRREIRIMKENSHALDALRYLHPRGVAHRDLKPENILVESRSPLSVKLADFGLANDKPDLDTECGTQLYTAPEVYLGRIYTPLVDLWSLGVIIFEYVYGLPQANRQKRGQDKRSIKPEERLSADACLAKGYDLGLFHDHSRDSGSATPTQQTALQGKSSDDDGTITIRLDALSAYETPKHDGYSRSGCRNPDRTSGILESCSFRNPPSDGNGRRSQLATAPDQSGSNGESSADLSYPLNAGSTYPGGLKRQRSPVVGSPNSPSSRGRAKRRPSGVPVPEVPVPHELGISDRRLGYDGELNHFCTIYDTTLALLNDLVGKKSQDIDDRTSTLMAELSEYLARLGITGMRLTRNDPSGQAIIATDLDSQEIVLARLAPAVLMNSMADLTAHLLCLVKLNFPPKAGTSAVPNDEQSLRENSDMHDNYSRSGTVNGIDGDMGTSITRQHGLTYPSALVDWANISGCSIP
ncbi:MAG: hypothetical protein Q9196_001912 [Gyalolechia fulgens]